MASLFEEQTSPYHLSVAKDGTLLTGCALFSWYAARVAIVGRIAKNADGVSIGAVPSKWDITWQGVAKSEKELPLSLMPRVSDYSHPGENSGDRFCQWCIDDRTCLA